MDALDAIMRRRSIRAFADEDVPEETVELLLRAAMAAPSACNQQPWEFIIVRAKDVLKKVPSFQPFSSMLPHAACGIFVCANNERMTIPKCAPYWVQDCSAATQNILLAAHAIGLGAVWLGAYPTKETCDGISRLLSLPPNITPFAMIAIGVPAEEKPPSSRYDPSRVHIGAW